MNFFTVLTPVTYWILIVLWSFILVFYIKRLRSTRKEGKLISVLILILSIDAFRTLFESAYFGAWYTALAGFLPKYVHTFLIRPELVFIPKILNVIAAVIVIGLLLYQWLPKEEAEKHALNEIIEKRTKALTTTNKNLQNEIKEHKRTAEDLLARTCELSDTVAELKQEEVRYKKTIEISIDGFWIIDTKGEFLEVNHAYCQMIGYDRNELLTMSIMDIDVIYQPEDILKRIGKVMEQGSDRFETKHRHKLGQIIDVEVSTTYTPDNNGLFFVFLRDITDRKQMENQIQQGQRMESIGNLAGGIAHDFNNLLYPIIGMSEMLLEDLPSGSPEHESAREIFSAGKRAGDLVQQILSFSRRSELKKIPLRIQQILKEALKLSGATIPSNIDITHDIQTDCGRVLADPTQIHQIAMNLITNAFHAVEKTNGSITLCLKEVTLKKEMPSLNAGQYALLSVTDTGGGIAPGILDKIFDPYFTTKQQGKGTGLGLAVVYGIVKEHNGDIKVESQLGRGTTVCVYLPLMLESNEFIPSDETPKFATGTERILLVDDEASITKLEEQILQRLGYTVTSFTDSMKAFQAFQAAPDSFDLVVSDMTMPRMTGDYLATELMKIKPTIPIIICTGFSERMNQKKAERVGIKGVLMKPIIKAEMAQMIRTVLDNANA